MILCTSENSEAMISRRSYVKGEVTKKKRVDEEDITRDALCKCCLRYWMNLAGVSRLRYEGVAKVNVVPLHVRDNNSSKVKFGQVECLLTGTCLMADGYELLNGTELKLRCIL